MRAHFKSVLVFTFACAIFEIVSRELVYIPNIDVFVAVFIAYSGLRRGFKTAALTTGIAVVFLASVHVWEPIRLGTLEKLLFWFVSLSSVALIVEVYRSRVTSEERAEQERIKRMQELAALAESVPHVVWQTDARGEYEYFSGRWTELTGLAADLPSMRKTLRSAIHHEDVERVANDWTEALKQTKRFDASFRVRSRSGEYRWCRSVGSPVRDYKGKTEKWIGTLSDIHDEQESFDALENANAKLSASEERLRTIVNESPFPMQTFDRTGKVTSVNRAWMQMWDLSEADARSFMVEGYNIFQDPLMITLGLRDAINRAFSGNPVTAPPVLYDPGEVGSSRRARWVETYFTPIVDAQGKLTEVILTFKDVTQQRELDRRLEEQRRQFELIADNSPAVIYMKDLEGRLSFVNQVYLDLLGLPKSQVLGRDERELWPEEAVKKFREIDLEVVRSRKPVRREEVVPSGTGQRHYLSVKFPVMSSTGSVIAVCGISTDITEQKNAEGERTALELRERLALESSRMKSQFLANMSHEIRTPINGIMGMSSLLADTPVSEEQKSYLDAIQRSSESLLTVINDILDFSKVEAGKMEFEQINFDLLEVLSDTCKSFHYAARTKGVRLVQDFYPDLPIAVRGDPGRVRQILNNLIGNAFKFTSKGAITVTARLVETRDRSALLRFEIQDTGIGIPPAAFERIFQAFSQADVSTTRRFGGTGLGLSISKHLVEQMKGRIGVTSHESSGSCFWFEIELEVATESLRRSREPAISMATSASAASSTAVEVPRTVRILVAEDNQINRAIALKTLEKLGFRADAVADGREVLEAIREVPYDLILMDCQMPNMDGYEATRVIRTSPGFAEFSEIPILALTANAMAGDAERCLREGMNDYLAKPLSRSELNDAILRWVSAS